MGYPRKQPTQLTNPAHGENAQGYLNRVQIANSHSRNNWQMEHKRVHYCCYGGFPCYICPLWDNVDTILGYAQWATDKLKKLNWELYYNQKTPESLGKWVPRHLRS